MAPRKTTSRKRRSVRTKNSGYSTTAVITLGAIVAIGAASLWATSQNKSPSASVSNLFHNTMAAASGASASGASASDHQSKSTFSSPSPAVAKPVQTQSRPSAPVTTAIQPAPRPRLGVGQSVASSQNNQPKQVALLSPLAATKPTAPASPVNKPAAERTTATTAKTTLALPPVGKPVPDDNSRHASGAFKVPKVIIARQALIIREKAWDQAKTVGSVEKGREMRSYAKVGRWHRVVVPSTNIIGWVQEDQLAFKNARNHSSPLRSALAKQPSLITGAIGQTGSAPVQKVPAHPNKPHNTGLIAPLYPQQPVGKSQ